METSESQPSDKLAGVRAMNARNAARKAAGLPIGRPKGVANPLTRMVRQALLEAFKELGGTEYLVRFGRRHPAAFVALLMKGIPRERELNALGTGVQIYIATADNMRPQAVATIDVQTDAADNVAE